MKPLVVFVSALVLVAQGKAAPSNDEDRVNQVQAEVVAGYASVDEDTGGVGPQAAFVEGAPAADKPWVVGPGPGPQRYFGLEELAGEINVYLPQTIYFPFITRACTASACLQICNLLGFANGTCVSDSTCQCYN